jgi:glucose-fructose oxidoreductase
MGYGTTLGTWHLGGRKPIEVTAMCDEQPCLEVDEHSISVIRYEFGLSKTETCWGTFTDPWTHPPQPRCGFVLKGTDGTIACLDYEPALRVQTRQKPEGYDLRGATLKAPLRNGIENMIAHIDKGTPLIGPLTLEISRIGQQIVDTAVLSAQQKRAVKLVG